MHRFSPTHLPCPIRDDSKVKDKLRYHRKQAALTQEQAAERIGIDRTTYILWESEELTYYPADKLAKAAEVFGCETSELSDE